jgi:hypothetical protein
MKLQANLSYVRIVLPLVVLLGCSDDDRAIEPEAQVAARLIVTEEGDSATVRLDSSALGGVEVEAQVLVASHPWTEDSVQVRKRGDRWIVSPLPDGPWRISATLTDPQGRVRATGSKGFVRRTPFTLCGHELSVGEWVGLLGGNLVIVSGMNEGARSGRDVVKEILAVMTLGAIDFDRLSNLRLRFSNGVYQYGTDPERVETRFAFVAARSFGAYQVGDTLRENIGDVSSFVKNISLSLTKGLTWDRGGLFGLIQGSVGFSGRTPSFEIDPSRLSLTLATRARIERPRSTVRLRADTLVFTPVASDSLTFRFSLAPMTLGALQAALDDGTLEFSHDGTTYRSVADGVSHAFHDSRVRLYDDSADRAQFDGSYEVAASSGSFAYHHRGTISSTAEQTTLFACDAALQDTIGVAHHAADLSRGTFVTRSGFRVPYGLVPF